MKRGALPIAALAAGVLAQAPDTTTVTYSVCPTATTTTITLSSTITYCPGGYCNVTPSPTITAAPTYAPGWGDYGYTSKVLAITFTGKDGKVTELNEYVTVYPAPCPNGPGMCGAEYTITEECPCTAHGHDHIPNDFTTTVHKCHSCGHDGGPTTITQTIPCTDGAYATVTPKLGPWKGVKADGSAGDWSDAGDYNSAWNDAGDDGQSWGDSPAAGAGGAPKWADAGAAPGTGAGAAPVGADGKPVAPAVGGWGDNGADPAAGGWGDNGADPAAGAGAGGKPVAPAVGANGKPAGWADNGAAPAAGAPAGGAGGKPVADVSAGAASGTAAATSGWKDNKVAPYTGAANKAALALSTVVVGAVGALAMML